MSELFKIGPFAQDGRWGDIVAMLRADEALSLPQLTKDTALCELCFYGHEPSVQLLLDIKANPSFRFGYEDRSQVAYRLGGYPRTTPLGQSILGKSQGRFQTIGVMELLLAAGADPNGNTYQGYTPLQLAIIENCAEHARALLRAGADVTRKCEDPLIPEGDAHYFAAEYEEGSKWAREMLAAHGRGASVSLDTGTSGIYRDIYSAS